MTRKQIKAAEFAALMQHTPTAQEEAEFRRELEQAFTRLSDPNGIEHLEGLVERAKLYTSYEEHTRLWMRFRAARAEELDRRRKERNAGRKRRSPEMWDYVADLVAHEEQLIQRNHRLREAAQKHRGNMMTINRTLANPHQDVDLRKLRGRVTRAQDYVLEEDAADLERRYQEFVEEVGRLRGEQG